SCVLRVEHAEVAFRVDGLHRPALFDRGGVALRIPDLDPVELPVQDGFLAESCTGDECRWKGDASLRIHRHFGGGLEYRSEDRSTAQISDRNAAKASFHSLPLPGSVENETAFESGDEDEVTNRGMSAFGATHGSRNRDAALVVDRVCLGPEEAGHAARPRLTTTTHTSPPPPNSPRQGTKGRPHDRCKTIRARSRK